MKFFIVLALVAAVAVAAPADPKDAVVEVYEVDNIGVEGYNYRVKTSDGKSASESAQLQNIGTPDEALSVRGEFSYLGNDGVLYQVSYVADKNGFQPQGAHLPA